MRQKIYHYTALFAATVVLSACGGGGGDDDTGAQADSAACFNAGFYRTGSQINYTQSSRTNNAQTYEAVIFHRVVSQREENGVSTMLVESNAGGAFGNTLYSIDKGALLYHGYGNLDTPLYSSKESLTPARQSVIAMKEGQATTQNIVQTGDLLVLRQAHRIFISLIQKTLTAMADLAERSAEMVMPARTLGDHMAEYITLLGLFAATGGKIGREIYTLMAAWMDIQQRMASYRAIVSVPWNRAFERYSAALKEKQEQGGEQETDWRKAFGVWSGIANEELIKNQRSDEFLGAQRELLRSALAVRTQQQKISDSVAKLFGLPTQQDFDEVTRQLTEMRRELRAHLRSQRRAERAGAGEASAGKTSAAAVAKRTGRGKA